jgi:transposase InsO family protein
MEPEEYSEETKRSILRLHHDSVVGGHLGRDQTYNSVAKAHKWTGMRDWIAEYVKGCATCQQNKPITHPKKTPLYRIPVPPEAMPFQVIALDLITQLPRCDGFDAILTVVDHGCSRAAIFIPCTTLITGEGVAELYFKNVYQWFGLPNKVISDRDPRFTSHFAKALCEQLGIDQNVSTAFHPQTDGLTERKNQWVKQFLRTITMHQQNDWAQWLPLATAVHNRAVNATTEVPPSEALLGYLPRLDYRMDEPSMNPQVEERKETAFKKREQAKAALNRVANVTPKDQFRVNDKVWLSGKNLALPYQTLKLAPRRHGPFLITHRISPVAYRLELPPTWTIHDVFHAGLLTPYRETDQYGPSHTRPPPDLIGGEEEFEVEAIMNH